MSEILTRWQDPTIEELKKQLQQKENIIKEAREYCDNRIQYFNEMREEKMDIVESEEDSIENILEILDKENKE